MGTNDARVALLSRLIDHAPTFPPASLATSDALSEDALAVASPHAFMLGRLVWPASALDGASASGRPLSLVLDAPAPAGATIEAVEARYRDDLESLAGLAPDVYVEVPLDDALEECLDRLGAHGFHAKVRCGGDTMPGSRELAGFVRSCRSRGLAFKATAGLHRAVRTNGDHGLLNLVAAAVFDGDEQGALDEIDPAAFSLDTATFSWRDRSAAPPELARARSSVLHSIGSCSFFEPVGELESLGMLPR